MTNIQPATDSEVGAVKRHLNEHGHIPAAYVRGLIARIEHDQAKLDAKDWALGKILNLLTNLDCPLQPHERQIIQTAQAALTAQPKGY